MKKVNHEVVMIADDNEIDVFICRKIMELNGFHKSVINKKSGKAALEHLQKSKELPGLIILDLNMPVVDGFGFLMGYQYLEEHLRDQITLVILTSSMNDLDRERVRKDDSVTHFLAKPMDDDKFALIENSMKSVLRATK